jgi:hypothetical protein
MPSINIQLPVMDAEKSIEIEVRINGERKRYNYRIEIFHWQDCPEPQKHAECLREMIQNYDQQWQVIQIGGPTEKNIPIMFKQITN